MPRQTEACLTDADYSLERRVRNCLSERHLPGLRRLDIEVDRGTVILRGKLRTYYEKQLCHAYCRHVPGVVKLIDEIDVNYTPRPVGVG